MTLSGVHVLKNRKSQASFLRLKQMDGNSIPSVLQSCNIVGYRMSIHDAIIMGGIEKW